MCSRQTFIFTRDFTTEPGITLPGNVGGGHIERAKIKRTLYISIKRPLKHGENTVFLTHSVRAELLTVEARACVQFTKLSE